MKKLEAADCAMYNSIESTALAITWRLEMLMLAVEGSLHETPT